MVPGANVIALKVTRGSSNVADISDIRDALAWVLEHREEHNITAVNISLGLGSVVKGEPYGMLEPLYKALSDAGVFIAVAAGNAYGPNASEGLNELAASNYVTAVGAVWDEDAGPATFSTGAIDYSTGPIELLHSRSVKRDSIFWLQAPTFWGSTRPMD